MTRVVIRQAKAVDASNLYRLLDEAHKDNPLYPPKDPTLGLLWIANTLSSGYVIVADVSGRLVGSLALTNYQFPYSPQWYMYLEWLFVQKPFRADGAFDALMAAAHAYADEKGAPILAGISVSGKDVFMKDRLLQTKGYTYIGGSFIRSAAHGQQHEEDQAGVQAAVVD